MSLSISNLPGAARLQPTGTIAAASSGSEAATLREKNRTLVDSAPYLASLTATDLEVVYQATGVRLDESSKTFPLLAADIGLARQTGELPAGKSIDVDYLARMLEKYSGPEWADSLGTQLRTAIDYLEQRGGQPGVNLMA